ncbi:MAG TPA: tRNA (adenosine(37)-N6)-threonylcarbamoyltransferase complex dimerization subunit type 1 TsaB [Myxococcota bacterium]|nr:tRNA (adenosine(37)-N6)-threonylcarbamoyltransferase complex dimerization subunit type 1 TsaB [Myxococcota bacterium]HND31452.1 tRNA (adenosine(37)-N6)-threonylcarbamoyltransferase complex dimerization subunit type 1 TsaB [Myxococcota bacterium]
MRTLLLDSASPVIGVAAYVGDEPVWQDSVRQLQGADAWLGPALEAGIQALGGLDRVAVVVGPGTFTGLRVGVASALGLAMAHTIEVVPLSSLALRAWLSPESPEVLVVLDARKDRVYAGLFGWDAGGPVLRRAEWDCAPEELCALPPAVVVGEGALRYRALLEKGGHRVVEQPDRSAVGQVGPWLRAQTARPLHEISLHYLRAPDAKIPAEMRQNGSERVDPVAEGR